MGRRDRAERRISRATGRVMEMLSEHQLRGLLEGYLLTGRHGLFNCYEALSISSIRCSTSTPSG